MKNIDKFVDQENWDNYIGKEVVKHSGKPFKNKCAIGTVEDIQINPQSNKKAFLIKETGQLIDCYQVKLFTGFGN